MAYHVSIPQGLMSSLCEGLSAKVSL